jgi:syntaxin-binding protein 1
VSQRSFVRLLLFAWELIIILTLDHRGLTAALQSSESLEDESEYASSRYVPSLKTILMELLANQLSTDDYPSVIPMPPNASSSTSATSARRGGKASARKKGGGTDNKWSRTGSNPGGTSGSSTHYTGARNLIFMVGGMAYSEVRICRDIMEKESREIIMGSTRFVSPSDFMDDLATLVE